MEYLNTGWYVSLLGLSKKPLSENCEMPALFARYRILKDIRPPASILYPLGVPLSTERLSEMATLFGAALDGHAITMICTSRRVTDICLPLRYSCTSTANAYLP